nr:MAG TPA: hypothetical protein [Caudoviricetes sp.]
MDEHITYTGMAMTATPLLAAAPFFRLVKRL